MLQEKIPCGVDRNPAITMRLTVAVLAVAAVTVDSFTSIRPYRPMALRATPTDDLETMVPNNANVASSRKPTAGDGIYEFDNQSLFAWLRMYLRAGGVVPDQGKTPFLGPVTVDVDPANKVSPKESQRLRAQAKVDLTNINMTERLRRAKASQVMTLVAILYILWATLIADDGGWTGHALRFASGVPLLFAYGYNQSAETGL